MNLEKAKILLTGGTGFVGQQLIPKLRHVSITTRNRQKALERFGNDVVEVSSVGSRSIAA